MSLRPSLNWSLLPLAAFLMLACGDPDCGAGAESCDGVCVDLRFDPANCGGCAMACDDGLVCSDGVCGSSCGAGTDECDGRCADLQLDPSNCGACGTACAEGEFCSAGACGDSCGGDTTECDGQCVDTGADPGNCGGCQIDCQPGNMCLDGTCTLECSGDLTECSGSCVDTDLDPANCGACGMGCPDGEVCSAGACATTCGTGTELCDGACVDLQLDPANCGGCADTCAAEEVCSGGSCGDFCGAGTELCVDVCADTQNDRNNCGTCGMGCGTTEACVAGLCQPLCPDGLTACDGACVDTTSDAANCSACGMACTMSEVCRASTCDTARAVGVATTVSRNGRIAEDAWLIYEDALDTPRRLNPTRFESGSVQAAQLTANGDVVVFAAQDTEGLYELYVARATTTGLTKLNAELPATVGIQQWALSPDQTRAVYVTTDPGDGSERVFTVSLDVPGTVSARDTDLLADADAQVAQVANDGGVFVLAETEGGVEMYFIPVGSTTPVEIIGAGADDIVDRFYVSADGQYVVLEVLSEDEELDLHVGERDGTSTPLSLPEDADLEGVMLSEGTSGVYLLDENVLVVFSLTDPTTQTQLTAAARFEEVGDVYIVPSGDRVVFGGDGDAGYRVYVTDLSTPDVARLIGGALERHRYTSGVAMSGDGSQVVAQYETILPRVTVAATDGSTGVAEPDVLTGATVYSHEAVALVEDGSFGFFPYHVEDDLTGALFATPLPETDWQRVDLGLVHDGPGFSHLTATPSGSYAAFVATLDDPYTEALHGFVPGASDLAVQLSAPIERGTDIRDFALRDAGDVAVYVAATAGPGEYDVFATAIATPGVSTQINPALVGTSVLQVWIDGDDVYYTTETAASGSDLYRASLTSPGTQTLVMAAVRDLEIHGGDLYLTHYDPATGESRLSVVTEGVASQLTPDGVEVDRFIVSADLDHLYFQEDAGDRALWHLDLVAGGAPLLMIGAAHSSRDFATSADGARLVFIDDARSSGIDEVWMVELAAPEVGIQLNANFSGTNRDAWEVQITAAGDFVVFRADVVSNRDELFVVDPENPQTSQTRLHEAMGNSSEDVYAGWVLLVDQVLFRADFTASQNTLYRAPLVVDVQSALSFDDSNSDVDTFVVAGNRAIYYGAEVQTREAFDVPVDGSSERAVRTQPVRPADVGAVRPAGGASTDQTPGISIGVGGGGGP